MSSDNVLVIYDNFLSVLNLAKSEEKMVVTKLAIGDCYACKEEKVLRWLCP